MIPPVSRRARIDRWIISLTPCFDVINQKVKTLKLGEPRLELGPTFMPRGESSCGTERIRRGAVWYLHGVQTGFHVDFHSAGLHIEAWSGKDRTVSLWVAGAYTEESLKKDLSVTLAASGLTDLARTTQVRKFLTGK